MTGKTEGPVSRLINRRVSGRITGFILNRGLPLTPNQVSLIAFATALAAAALIDRGELLIGGVLVELSSILDGVDGELARALGLASRRGAFLDTVLDRYADIAIYLATLHHLLESRAASPEAAALLAFAAVTGDLMVSYIHARGQMDLGVHPASQGPLDSAASRDVRLFTLALLIAAGQPLPALAAVAALSHTYVAVKFLYLLTAHKP
ncbi:CDP-alcohol phosphatidyltransferase family protein [Stetteria hydrogenophila]